jgi:predicted transcriptional regulator
MTTADRELPARYVAAQMQHDRDMRRPVVPAPTFTAPIYLIRSGLGITLDQMAANIGVSRSYLSRIETGTRVATEDLLEKIYAYLTEQLSFKKKSK